MKGKKRERGAGGAPFADIRQIEIDLGEFARMSEGYCFGNQLMMANILPLNIEFLNESRKHRNSVRIDAWCFILVTAGSLTLSLNFRRTTLGSGSVVLLSPFDTIDSSDLSPDGRFYLIVVKKEFIEDSMAERKVIPIGNLLSVADRKEAVISLDSKEMEGIKRNFDIIYYYLKAERGEYQGYLLRSAFYMLTVELIVLINNRIAVPGNENGEKRASGKRSDRKEQIVLKFFALLRSHAESEHNPSFYAGSLFISVQYLSLLLKESTGHTASFWIDNEIVRMAKNMLNIPGCTISQVAEHLHFADQSSFGKFFKRHTGIAPKKYSET